MEKLTDYEMIIDSLVPARSGESATIMCGDGVIFLASYWRLRWCTLVVLETECNCVANSFHSTGQVFVVGIVQVGRAVGLVRVIKRRHLHLFNCGDAWVKICYATLHKRSKSQQYEAPCSYGRSTSLHVSCSA